jgi:hypothetical protein
MTAPTKTWIDVARRLWPDAAYVTGDGPFATVRGCGRTTVVLHPTVEQARVALRDMHPGSDGWCLQKHVLIALDLPESRAA